MLKRFPENKCRLCGNIKSKGVNIFSESAKRSGLISKITKRLSREIASRCSSAASGSLLMASLGILSGPADFLLGSFLMMVRVLEGDDLPQFVCADCEGTVHQFSEFCAMVQAVQRRLEREKRSFVRAGGGAGAEGPGPGEPTVMVGPGSRLECTLCGTLIDAAEHTTLHMVGHGIGTVICQCRACGRRAELPHFLRAGDERAVARCEDCRRAAPGPFACDVCSKGFRTRGHLSRHQLTHSGAKPFLCEVCGCGFGQKSSLKLHVLSHARLNPHECGRCGRGFRLKVSLQSHVLNVHGGAEGVARHRCDKCGKRFVTRYKLRRHYRSHTGDRPYACARCGKLFSQSGNLNLHRRKHEEEDAASFRAPEPGPGQYAPPPFGAATGQFSVAGGSDKAKSGDSELFAHFGHDALLFMDEAGGPDSETIALPTFSSLQAGALPHH
ncbi:zinc finger protein 316-like isoform X2 [Bacillus rossius redtenbacheri]|uniref:zinc finger protein 316-like isoform X2 n=1 Tax=Bacillus rossius redtenbacheri TaxID=93214 RepID=UPI002FDDF418